MDKQEEKLINKYGKEGGWKVPEGYFDSVFKEISDKLPEQPEVVRHVEMTRWQRFKPYVYLAAMFAGIWLMMQVFHHAAGDVTTNLDNPPEHIAIAMADSDMNEVFAYTSSGFSDMELENDISEQYESIEDFLQDFNEAVE